MIKIKRSQPKFQQKSQAPIIQQEPQGGIGLVKNRQNAQDRVADVSFDFFCYSKIFNSFKTLISNRQQMRQ